MNNRQRPDWDPISPAVQTNQRTAYDELRERCPVAYSDFSGWALFRHQDIERVLHDPHTYSNAVSRHLSVPNGMDPPEHTVFRAVIEPYFAPAKIAAFAPTCRRIAEELVVTAVSRGTVELMSEFAQAFAVRTQCAFLGWPAVMREPLRAWTRKNQAATLAQDRLAMAAIAREFTDYVDELLQVRRDAGSGPDDDLTASLLHETVWERPLHFEEIVSILRNWTVGEVGTLSASVGILVHHLASEPALQQRLRAELARLPDAIEEILRLHGPLVSNRRITTRAVEIGGRRIEAGERVSINWIAANRDRRVFDAPQECRIDRDQSRSLLYGAGIHVCPGAPLVRMEMRAILQALLAGSRRIELDSADPPTRAVFPASGFARLALCID